MERIADEISLVRQNPSTYGSKTRAEAMIVFPSAVFMERISEHLRFKFQFRLT